MSLEEALEVADEYFSFDYLGDAMMDLRREIGNADLQASLAEELARVMAEETGEDDPVFADAAKERVAQFVKSIKASAKSGCGK